MKVSIERGHFEALLAEFPRLQPWAAQLRFGNRVEMGSSQKTEKIVR